MKIIKYNSYNFILENFPKDMITESSEFGDGQMGQATGPLGPGFGMAQDPSLSVYSDSSAPYIDNYQRLSKTVQDLSRVMKNLYGQGAISISKHKLDYFLEDVDDYQNLKILRIFKNNKLGLDVFISFMFMDEEFFGVFRDFNGENKTRLDTDFYSDPKFSYIDGEYCLKMNNYFYKILYNWFIPTVGEYTVLTDELMVKNSMGDNKIIKKGQKIKIKGYNTDANGKSFLILQFKTDTYKIIGNDFYYFKYWCKKNNS